MLPAPINPAAARTKNPIDRAIAEAVAELRHFVDRDLERRGERRRASNSFRQARLMLGHQLNVRRRGLSKQSFGAVLRGLGLNRHTANHAMRLAAEFSRPDGSLDPDKVADARDRYAGLLRTSIPGQRVLAAAPDALSIMDLRRIMAVRDRACTRQQPKRDVDAPSTSRIDGCSGVADGCTRHEAERMVDHGSTTDHGSSAEARGSCPPALRLDHGGMGSGGAGTEPPGAAAPAAGAARAAKQQSSKAANEGSGLESPPPCVADTSPPVSLTPCLADRSIAEPPAPKPFIVGEQLRLGFDETVSSLTMHLGRVINRARLGGIDKGGLDRLQRMAAELDREALSLLRGAAG